MWKQKYSEYHRTPSAHDLDLFTFTVTGFRGSDGEPATNGNATRAVIICGRSWARTAQVDFYNTFKLSHTTICSAKSAPTAMMTYTPEN